MQSYPLTFGVWRPRGINTLNVYIFYGLYINKKYINLYREREIDIHHRNLNSR